MLVPNKPTPEELKLRAAIFTIPVLKPAVDVDELFSSLNAAAAADVPLALIKEGYDKIPASMRQLHDEVNHLREAFVRANKGWATAREENAKLRREMASEVARRAQALINQAQAAEASAKSMAAAANAAKHEAERALAADKAGAEARISQARDEIHQERESLEVQAKELKLREMAAVAGDDKVAALRAALREELFAELNEETRLELNEETRFVGERERVCSEPQIQEAALPRRKPRKSALLRKLLERESTRHRKQHPLKRLHGFHLVANEKRSSAKLFGATTEAARPPTPEALASAETSPAASDTDE